MSSAYECDTPPSSPDEEQDIDALIMAMNAFSMSQDVSAKATCFHKFPKLPIELQNLVWHWVSLSSGKTVTAVIGKKSFKYDYDCLPAIPAFFHACSAARLVGQKTSLAVDAIGKQQDPTKSTTQYFYLNFLNDDFILRFEKDTVCSYPAYCSAAVVAPDARRKQHDDEEALILENKSLLERLAEDDWYNAATATRNTLPMPFYQFVAGLNTGGILNNTNANVQIQLTQAPHYLTMAGFYTAPAQPAARPAGHDPDILVFPDSAILPSFFPKLASVGLHLHLPCSHIDLTSYSLPDLHDWARTTLTPKLDKQLPLLLEQFPNLEYLFYTIRQFGLSNHDWRNGVERKHWRKVMLEDAAGGRWGRRECEVMEREIRRWLLLHCTSNGRLMMKFELCVQWDSRLKK
jgi:hypothetical protein